MIGKAGLLTKVPFIGPPVAAALRQLEGVVDVSTPSPGISISVVTPAPGRHVQLLTCAINR